MKISLAVFWGCGILLASEGRNAPEKMPIDITLG